VSAGQFLDATLILLGHGTTLNESSQLPVWQHAEELRRRGIFAAVHPAFWKQTPQIHSVLTTIKSPRAFLVPVMTSEGYFANQVIPQALGFAGRTTRQMDRTLVHYCHPVGTHPRMARVLVSRATEVVARFPFPYAPKPHNLTLFIAGHGTPRHPQSRHAVEFQANLVRALNWYAEVRDVYLDEAPYIKDCQQSASTRAVVVVPFFISDGLHVVEDIPVLLGEPERLVKERLAAGQPTWRNPSEKHGKLTWYAPAVGTAPELSEIILERVREADTPDKA